jgi:uncharacterized protein involved in outer membrane biogenesis
MKKAITIVGAVVAVAVIVIAAVLIYAARNLNSLIAEREPVLMQKVSDALGRKVEVASIKASLGWGLVAELTGLKIEDDPALSDRPFMEASEASAKVDLLPLLSRRIHVTKVTLKNPVIRLIRTEQGEFNVSKIGKRSGTEKEAPPPENLPQGSIEQAPITSANGTMTAKPEKRGAENLAAVYVQSLLVDNGVIVYEERGANTQTVSINDVVVTVKDFRVTRAFDFTLKLAILSDKENVDISGTAGPLAPAGALDLKNAHFAIQEKVGPLDLAKLRAIGSIGKAIPEALSVPDPISFQANVDGTPSAAKFHVESDLSGNRIAWADAFDKPASVTFKLSADGSRTDAKVEVTQANIQLGDLDARASNLKFDAGNLSARIDTNRFDVGSLGKMVLALQKYDASGHVEVHSDVQRANKQPSAHGSVSLADVALALPDAKQALVSNLNGDIKLDGNTANVGPLKFDVGDGHAAATLTASSLQPLIATYNFSIDKIKPGDLVSDRPAGEYLSTVLAVGNITQSEPLPKLPSGTAKVSIAEGNIANAAFKDLSLAATTDGRQADIQSLKVAVFNGNVAGSGTATLDKTPQFSFDLNANNVDIQQALMVQDPKSAAMFRGNVDTQLQVSGRGAKFDDIKPTLKGSGRAAVRNGKLVGVNLIRIALDKTKGIPEIGDLIPASLMKRHPELFDNADTDIDRASLTFVLNGIRISTRDLVVQAADYGMTAAGWFDMDKNVDLSGHALLTPQFSKEIIDAKRNVVYITNQNGQVDIPLRISGKLPKPDVSPDLATLAQNATGHLLRQTGKGVVDKLFGSKKGKNNNPLDQLKGLFN